MSLLPDIVDGKLSEEDPIKIPKLYTFPTGLHYKKARRGQLDEHLGALNNLGHEEVKKDFSDSSYV